MKKFIPLFLLGAFASFVSCRETEELSVSPKAVNNNNAISIKESNMVNASTYSTDSISINHLVTNSVENDPTKKETQDW